jgi:hypothetical protein
MASVQDIVNGLQQAADAAGYDGALDDKGEPVKVGLKREEGHPINDSRVMDGFSVKFAGPQLIVHYHSECQLKDVHDGEKFESEIEEMISKVAAFLRKEYKRITGKGITLSPVKDTFQAIVQTTSRVRAWVQAQKAFTIGGMSKALEVRDDSETPSPDKAWKRWLDAPDQGSKPENVKIGKDKQKGEIK